MKTKKYIYRFIFINFTAIALSILLNRFGLAKENNIMVYIIAVLLTATVTEGYTYGLTAAFLGGLSFNYLFTAPQYNFHMSDSNDYTLILFFLVTSFIGCNLTDRFQRQLEISRENEKKTNQLFVLTDKLLNVSGVNQIIEEGQKYIKDSIHVDVQISQEYQKESKYVYPITGVNRQLGCIILPEGEYTSDDILIVRAVANQLGNALDRDLTYQEQEKILIAMEKEHFSNNMLRSISHDLRTPLTGIAGASELMMYQNLDVDTYKKLSNDINEQANWLNNIVENILNMSKIDNGSFEITKNLELVDDLIHEAIRKLPELRNRNFQLSIPSDLLMVNVDGKMIVQVIVNLLDNALKFTELKDRIGIKVEPSVDEVKVIVYDEGCGISSDIFDTVFDEFVTHPGISADSKKGIGLGLAICKAFIEQNGGTISCKNNEKKGCSFMFTLPLYKEVEE